MNQDHLQNHHQIAESHLRALLKDARAEIARLRLETKAREVVTVGGVGIEVEKQGGDNAEL